MRKPLTRLAACLLLSLTLAACSSLQAPAIPPAAGQAPAVADLPIRPDPRLTPGAIFPVTAEDVCRPGYAESVRHVPNRIRRQVFEEYGLADHESGAFEVDHLISLELGGSNELANLWPQAYQTEPWNAHKKDALEDRLRHGALPLAEAQQAIAADWIAAYQRYIGP
jgi:hypothetical protein